MKIRTDYMKVKTIGQFVGGLEDARDQLRREAEGGNLYSGLQADVIDPIVAKLKEILSGEAGS